MKLMTKEINPQDLWDIATRDLTTTDELPTVFGNVMDMMGIRRPQSQGGATNQRPKIAEFLREWADALEATND